MNMKKSLRVIFVDFLGLLIGVLNGILIPKVFDIESYAYLRTFTLYISYASMFHFGFSDGMYLILGGKNIADIKKEKIKGYFYVMLKIVAFSSVVLLIISAFFIKDVMFKYLIIYILPFQVVLFVSLLYRATGEFNKYTAIRVATNMLNLLTIGIVVLVVKSPIVYMRVQVIGYILIAVVTGAIIVFSTKRAEKIKYLEVKTITVMGFTVMIASSVNIVFVTLDRWFVKVRFSVSDFAYYSFAVSMLNLFLALVNSVTILFYPYLAKHNGDAKIVSSIKKYIILVCSFAPTGYFVLEFITKHYIKEYVPSLEILGVLVIGIPFITLSNVLYANLYKVDKRGKEYLILVTKMVMLAFLLNLLVSYVFNKSILIAYATLVTLIVWYLYSSRDFKGSEVHRNEIFHFILYILSYNLIYIIPAYSLIKAILFFLCMLISEYIFFSDDLKGIFKMVSKRKRRNV